MAMRYPGLPPQVRSGLLGTYTRRGEAGYTPPGSKGRGGGGGFGGQQFQAPDMSELSSKYLKGMPGIDVETDPSKLYEGTIGGYREDVQGAMTQAGQQAISQAATSGREVADVMARYLPEAVKGFGRGAADIAGQATTLGQQGQVAKSELQLKQKGMADEMARFDASAQQQQHQFMYQMQQEYQMQRNQLANNLKVAQAQAGSQREVQSVQNAHNMAMQQLKNSFAQKTQQYGESQANARQSMQLRTYDKWQQADAAQAGRGQTLSGVKMVGDYRDPYQPVSTGADQPGPATFQPGGMQGISGSVGGKQIKWNPQTGRYEVQ